MYAVFTLYRFSRFYSFKKGIGKHIKIEMVQICMKYFMLYNKLLQNLIISYKNYMPFCIIFEVGIKKHLRQLVQGGGLL